MKAGELRHVVEIQAPVETKDLHGQIVVTFPAEATRRAKIEPLSGREAFYASAVQPLQTHRVTLRYYATLTPKNRIVWGTRTFNIAAVHHTDERQQETIADCVEAP